MHGRGEALTNGAITRETSAARMRLADLDRFNLYSHLARY
jgi:hypothetical protein